MKRNWDIWLLVSIMSACIVAVFLVLAKAAFGAELVPVSPPTDWMGVGIVATIAILAIAVTGYVIHIKRTAGQQFGEEFIDSLADRLHAKQTQAAVVVPLPVADPLFYDGIQFASQSDLAQYKAAKEIVELRKGKSI